MRALTKAHFRVVQMGYFFLGLLQLVYMTYFSHYHMPSTCSLVQLFNLNVSISNCSGGNISDSNPVVSRDSNLWLWLVWPVILFAGNVCTFVMESSGHKCLGWHSALVDGIVSFCIQKRFTISFCVSVFFWYMGYVSGEMLLRYLEATSMVFLFGWTTSLVFFSGTAQPFYVFSVVVQGTIFHDITLSFLPVFLLTLLGFAFALHVLSLYNLPPDDEVYLRATVYDVFAASLGSSDYMEDTKEREVSGWYQIWVV